jgi:outer membrane lipoprotein
MSLSVLRACVFVILGGGICGCATTLPEAIREPPNPDVAVAAAQASPEQYRGTAVRWGGTLLAVRNRAQVTELEILSRPLGFNGRPEDDGAGMGRFVAEVPGFVDPATLPKDRLVTVAGTVAGATTRPVGDYPYLYPVVRATHYRLWAPPAPEPYWHRYPLAYPWYPWGPWWYRPWPYNW